MRTFAYLLKVHRPGLIDDASPEEEQLLSTHFQYLQRALSEGTLVLAGPCEDGAFGIVISRARTRQRAEEFVTNDPEVKGELMTAELHPFRISLMEQT